MILVTGRVEVAPEHRDRFARVATEMCARSREEAGCHGYRVYADLEQAGRYVFVEEWSGEDALMRHFRAAHTGAFLSEVEPLLSGPADALFHSVASSRRLEPGRGLVPVD